MDADKKHILEALLFSSGEAVEVPFLAEAIEESEEETYKLLEEMNKEYLENRRGIRLIKLENKYRMCSNPEYYSYLRKLALVPGKKKLSNIALETLSIIAYKQPVTKQEIEKIRGVKSDYIVNQLLDYRLIEEKGRLDAPGKPIIFGTSDEFLISFGLDSIEQLPHMEADEIKKLSKEAMEELNYVDESAEVKESSENSENPDNEENNETSEVSETEENLSNKSDETSPEKDSEEDRKESEQEGE